MIYTDGSGTHGGIGAAAVLYRPNASQPVQARWHVGTEATHTVYSAELEGISLALGQLARLQRQRQQQQRQAEDAIIFTDNQAAICAVRDPGRSSGQRHVRDVVERIDNLRHAG